MKYLLYNDINYLFNKRKIFLIMLILVPLVSLLLKINAQDIPIEILNASLGTSLNLDSIDFIQVIMFLFNIIIYVFFVTDIYVKDIAYQLDNIFLRFKPSNWFVKKTILFMISILFMKLLQYLAFIITFLIFKQQNIINLDFIKLFVSDYCYVIFAQFAFLLLYIITIRYKFLKLLLIVVFVLLVTFIPKNIYGISDYVIFFFMSVVFIQFIIYLVFKNSSKKIIENI